MLKPFLRILPGIFLLSLSSSTFAAGEPNNTPALTDNESIASYGAGYNIGRSLESQELTGLNVDALILGLKDSLAQKPLRVSEDALNKAFVALQEKEAKIFAEKSATNMKASETFLADNAKKKNIISLPSGLQYEVLTEGKGKKPAATDTVVVNYRGTLTDGKEFDSSYARNKPAEFALNRVIPGWTEALQLMPAGSKWRLYVPPKLAYGDQSPSPAIPPNSVLIFEVELLEVKAKS